MRLSQAVLPLILLLAAGSARAAETTTLTASSVTDLASLFEGEFTTLPAKGGGAAKPPKLLYNLAKRVRAPALGEDVVYAEQHEMSPDGPMLWQRLYAFALDDDLGVIVMKPYDFGNGAQLAGAYSDPTPLAKLEPTALKPQPDGCIVLWRRVETGFAGSLKPGSCADAPIAGQGDARNAVGPAILVTKTDYTEQPRDKAAKPVVFRRIH